MNTRTAATIWGQLAGQHKIGKANLDAPFAVGLLHAKTRKDLHKAASAHIALLCPGDKLMHKWVERVTGLNTFKSTPNHPRPGKSFTAAEEVYLASC